MSKQQLVLAFFANEVVDEALEETSNEEASVEETSEEDAAAYRTESFGSRSTCFEAPKRY